MGGQTQENLNQNWLTPEALIDFIEELRHIGFNIGMAEYIAAQDLLLMLTARGESLQEPRRAASLLGPLLCSSPAEQDAFPEHFERWAKRHQASLISEPIAHEETMAEALGDTAKRGLRWEWILFALGVVILSGTAWYLIRNFMHAEVLLPNNQPSPLDRTSDSLPLIQLASVAIGLLILAYVAWWVWWRRIANQFLQRRQGEGTPDIKQISLTASDEALFPSLTFLSLARMFRQRVQVVSRELNVVRTVEHSVEQGGWLNPVYDRLLIPPEYLVLVDRRSRFDHLAEFVEGMVKRLEMYGVFITAYAFDGDPRLCFPLHGKDAPQSLHELAAHHENMRLIIFSEAQGLLNPVSGRLAPWSRLFSRWIHRSVLTPESPMNWGATEYELQREFTLLPGTADGLAAFMRIIQGQEKVGEISTWAESAIPAILQERPQRWIERDVPQASQIDALLEEVKSYLGEDGYAWFEACAVYPELQWQITITLGQLLKDANEMPLLEPRRMIDLARLPWFRYGIMPDWLRTRLILDLEPDQEENIRTILEVLLVTAVQGHGESLDLEVAYEQRDWSSRLARPLLRLIQRESPPESSVHDHVFLDFMLQRLNLAVRVPETLRRQLFINSGDQIGWKLLLQWILANVLAMTPYLLIEMFSQNLGLDTLSMPTTGESLPVILVLSLLIGPFLGLSQWMVLRRFWRLNPFSWVGTTSIALSLNTLIVLLFTLMSGGSGPQLFGSELGFTNLAILGLLQAWLLARHKIPSSNLWWMGGFGVGLVNTLISFLFVQDTSSQMDSTLAFFTFGAIVVYGLISGWVLLYVLQSYKLSLVRLIRPLWLFANSIGFAIGLILAFLVFLALDNIDSNYTSENIYIGIVIVLLYFPIAFSQWYVFHFYKFSNSRLWFWATFLIPVMMFVLVFLPLKDLGNIEDSLLFILTGVTVGVALGLIQGLIWMKSGLRPFYSLVWLLCSTIGWSLIFEGVYSLGNSGFSPITWDHAVVYLLFITILPYGIITSFPLVPFLREVLHRQQTAKESLNHELGKFKPSPTTLVAQSASQDSSVRSPL